MEEIGVFETNLFPEHNRVKTVYEEYYSLLKKNYKLISLPRYSNEMELEQLKINTENSMRQIEFFFGYDRMIFDIRKEKKIDIPIILPMYADMTEGGMTLWINKNKFVSNDILLFSSQADYNIYKKTIINSPIYAEVVPLPIDKIFQEYNSKFIERKKFGLGNELILLYVGRLVEEKNIHEIIEVCKLLVKKIDFKLLIVGQWMSFLDNGKYEKEIKELVYEYCLDNYVIFMGEKSGEDLKNIYSMSDIFINLTKNMDENFGLAVVEAMSQKLPVVCTDWGGLKDHIVNEWNGFKIKTTYNGGKVFIDRDEIVKRIIYLSNKKLRHEFGENGRILFDKKYSNIVIQSQLEELIGFIKGKKSEEISLKFTEVAEQYCIKKILATKINKKFDKKYSFISEYATNSIEM